MWMWVGVWVEVFGYVFFKHTCVGFMRAKTKKDQRKLFGYKRRDTKAYWLIQIVLPRDSTLLIYNT